MPSIALFIKELLSEDMYSTEFSSRIHERIAVLNTAQLQGIYNHLVSTMASARSPMWREANKEIVDKIQETLDLQLKQAAAEKKVVEEYKMKKIQEKMKIKEAKREQERVQEAIRKKANERAKKEIEDLELQRQVKEKAEIISKVFKGEERRNRWWKMIFIFFIIGIVGVAVVTKIMKFPIYYALGGAFVILVISGSLAYHASTFLTVKPKQVLPAELEADIEAREDLLIQEAEEALKQKEIFYKQQVEKDRIEQKKRKKEQKAKERADAELIERQRQEQIAMAKEIIARDQAKKEEMSRMGSISSIETIGSATLEKG